MSNLSDIYGRQNVFSGMITPFLEHHRGVRWAVLMRIFLSALMFLWRMYMRERMLVLKGLQIIGRLRFRISWHDFLNEV